MKRNQSGFSIVEICLLLLVISVISFGGYYVWHSQKSSKPASSLPAKNSAPTSSTGTSSSAQTTLTLDQATTQAKTVYAAVDKMITGGQVLTDKSQWATANTSAAEDLQFINAHADWFTASFVSAANKQKSDNAVPTGGEFLICQSGIAYFNSDLTILGNSVNATKASLKATYTTGPGGPGGSTTHISFPITMKAVGGVWQIDSIDLSDSYCSQ